jgi:hypothetical protein
MIHNLRCIFPLYRLYHERLHLELVLTYNLTHFNHLNLTD